LNIPPITFIFSPTHHILINAWSSKLIWPITTSLYVFCIATWKHFMLSLWMDITNIIFQFFRIFNLLSLAILTPPHSPCTPFVYYVDFSTNCVNSFVDYDSTSTNYTDFSTNCGNTYVDCVNMHEDWANSIANSADTPNISSSDLWIPNPLFL
jgi:hypothetical protein